MREKMRKNMSRSKNTYRIIRFLTPLNEDNGTIKRKDKQPQEGLSSG
jgi:hypothetical protein